MSATDFTQPRTEAYHTLIQQIAEVTKNTQAHTLAAVEEVCVFHEGRTVVQLAEILLGYLKNEAYSKGIVQMFFYEIEHIKSQETAKRLRAEQLAKYPYLDFQWFHQKMQTLTPEERRNVKIYADEGVVRIAQDKGEEEEHVLLYQGELTEAFAELFAQLYGVPVDPAFIR